MDLSIITFIAYLGLFVLLLIDYGLIMGLEVGSDAYSIVFLSCSLLLFFAAVISSYFDQQVAVGFTLASIVPEIVFAVNVGNITDQKPEVIAGLVIPFTLKLILLILSSLTYFTTASSTSAPSRRPRFGNDVIY